MPRRKIVLPSQGNTGEETADGLPTEQIIHVDLHVQEPAPGVSSSHHHEVVTSGELVTSGDQIYKTVSVINISPDGSAETSNQSSEPASDKRNHSLEALFQAAHLERENISKTDTPKSAAASSSSSTAANETVTWVEVPNEDLNDGTSFLINTGGTGGTVVRELKQLVRMDSAREGHTLLSIPTSKEPASPSSPYQMKSAGVVQPTPSAPFANRSKSIDEVGGSKRLLMLEKTLRSLTGTTITTSVGPGGRKRKHPQKPGKHICPYCNRGCAKPSVLKKHIRAHTGERPYPCEICGFAFKTKSNLYKHCKSRWHQLKLGLMKDGKSASNSEDKEEIMDIEDDEVEEEEEDEEEECDDVLQIVSNEPPPPPIKPEKPVYKPGKSLDSARPLPTKKGVKRIKSENVPTTSKKLKKQAVMEMDDDSIKKMQSVHLQSGGTVISHLPSNAPTAAIVQTPPKPQMSPHPIIDVRSLSPGFAKTPIKETIPNPVFRIKPSTEDIILQSDLKPSSVLPGQIFHIPSSPASSSHAATSLQLPLKVSPMVLPVKDSPQKVQTMTLSRLGGSLDQKMARLGESSVSSDLSTSVQFSRSTSLNVGGLEVPTQNYHHLNIPKLEQKQMSMEKVMERISHLISQNQAIVSTPMAEPPRRRILRQSSAISPRAMTIAMSGPLTRSVSVTDRPLSNVAPVIPMPSIQSLSKMPSNLSDMQSVSEKVSRNTADMMTRSLSDTQPNSVVSDIILPRSMPETMLHNMPENMTITPIAAKKVEFPDQTVKQNQPILQPVLQLPKSVSNLLSPPSGGQALPRQIKIQFKLPKENIAAKPVQRQSSSLEVPASSIPEVALATQHIPVSDVKEPSAAAKARPQLAAMLQEQKQVEDTKERTETTTEKFVCGVCWYTSNSIEVLRNHTCNETQPSPKVAIPPRSESSVTVISEIEVVTDKEAKSASDMPRPRRVLQRQKNVVVEMVDPRTPPKRGRPKGAKNVLSEPKRPTLQRSQSALEMTAPPKTENIPEELKGEAPQALWKLKLKGHLLMKRSISVERMLSQEKEQQENKAQEGEPDESQLIKQAPLLRSKSYDETVLATQSIKSESVREKLLSKLSRSCHNLTHTQSVEEIDEEDESQMDSDAETKDAVRKIPVIPEVIITEPRPPSVENVTPIIPVNLESTVFFPEKLMYSPHLDVIKENSNRVPSTLSIPINIAHKAPGLLQEAKLTMPEESVSDKGNDKEQTEDMETNDAVQKKRNVCTLHTIQMAGESKQVQNKITATLLMLGHSNPTMNTVTLSTFCCIHKTQPMYVEKRNNQNVSMYSNWRAAPYNPNPKGLNSKLLLDLYQTMRYNVEPRFIQAASEKSLSKMWTHSDYWATREAQFDHETGEDADKAKFARLNAQPDNYPDVSLHKTGTESASAETTKSAAEPTVEVTETSVVTTRDKLKEALTIDKPKRVQIFDGGYKSLEEYVYVRGRGRGKYVCEKCGIRCKKPSMLKKHIRTHTDVRPYHCRHCNFSFKTKGNLTKHMKSKSHHKLCVDLGIVPVPTAVDDNCINPILGAQGGIFYDLDGPDVGHMEEVGDDDDDDDDDDEEDEDDEAMVIEQHNTEEVHPEMLEVEVISHPTKDISNPDQEDSMDDQTIEVVQINDPVEGFTAPKLGNPQASLDKEIAAASLLDLSKVTGSSEKDGNSPQEQDMDVEENDEAISAPPGKMDGPVTAKDIILQSTFRYLKSNNSYAKKIALLQAANSNESQSQDKDRDMSGFAPPLMFRGSDGGDDNDGLVTPIQSQQHSDTQKFGPIVGQFLLPDFKAEKPDLKTVISQITSIAASTASSDKSQIAALDPASIDDNVAYVSDEDHAPCEILPIPVGGEETGGDEQGRFVCDVCDKTFSKQQQYSLHKNAHLLERPYRCMDCGLAFQSRMLLDKHQSSERHQTQVALMQKLGASSSEDPRPFKCDECGIAFRIQGHLARHLRSKVHINKLEALTGRSPEYDGAGSNLDSYQVRLVPSESSCLTSASQSLIVETGEDLKAAIPALPTSVEETQPSESTATFKYQPPVEEYEKVVVASNERVTVEIKSEPIELGEIVPKAAASQKRDIDSESTDRHGAGPNKCGICGKTFKDMNSLKRHLVSHAELRPYVCEYCDAGFTTAQSLKFHLRTHTQDCPYMCGHCGATFGRSDLLQNHLTQAHFGIIVDEQLPSNKPVTVVTAPPAPAVQSPPPTIAVPQITVAASLATIAAPPLSVAAPPVTIAATPVTVAAPPQPQLISTAVPGQYMIQVVAPPGATPSSNQLQILPTASIPTGQSSVPVVMNSSLDSGLHPGTLPVHPGTLPSASQAEGGSSNSVLELDLHNYEVQEYLERGADGQERVVYMLVVPPSDGDTTRGTDDSPAPQATKHAPTLQEHAMAMSPIFDNDGTTGDDLKPS